MLNWLRNIIIVLSYIVIVMWLGWVTFKLSRWFLNSNHDGFVSNLVGGVMGGIVAYLIVLYQIKNQDKENRRLEEKQTRAAIVALHTEVKLNWGLINTIFLQHNASGAGNKGLRFKKNILQHSVWNEVRLQDNLVDRLEKTQYDILSNTYSNQMMLEFNIELELDIEPTVLKNYIDELEISLNLLDKLIKM